MILGYIFSLLNYFCTCLGMFFKEKKYILISNSIAKGLSIISLYFFGSLTGSYTMFVSLIRGIIAAIKEFNKEKIPKYINIIIYIIFQLFYTIILVKTFVGVTSLLVFFSQSLSLFYLWWLPPQKMRIASCINNLTYMTYQLMLHNWLGLLELVVVTSNITSYIKYRKIKED